MNIPNSLNTPFYYEILKIINIKLPKITLNLKTTVDRETLMSVNSCSQHFDKIKFDECVLEMH